MTRRRTDSNLTQRLARLLVAAVLLVSSCDTPVPPPRGGATPRVAKVTTIATLRAQERTSLVVNNNGLIFFVQHDKNEADTVYTIAGDGVPKRTTLDVRAICTALGYPEGRGEIQSLVATNTGDLIAYFVGGAGRTPLVAIVSASATGTNLRILADTAQITTQSGFGRSLELGEGLLALAGDDLFLWLRHPTAHQFYRVTPNGKPTEVLTSAFSGIIGQLSGEFRFDDRENRFTGDPDGSLWVVAPHQHALFRINSTGEITGNRAVKDLPIPRTAPVHLCDRNGKLLDRFIYICSRDDLPNDVAEVGELDPRAKYPLLVETDANRKVNFELSPHDIEMRPLFPTYALRIENLCFDPITRSMVAYDAMSGELLRISITGG